MTKENSGAVVDTLLYTVEGATSREKVEEELRVEDPSVERAVATLQGQKTAEQSKETENESKNR